MLNDDELNTLDAHARTLARRRFGGEGRVDRTSNGVVRLTLSKRGSGTGGIYRMREVSAKTLEAASLEVSFAIEAASTP